jgi:hypothetical protein
MSFRAKSRNLSAAGECTQPDLDNDRIGAEPVFAFTVAQWAEILRLRPQNDNLTGSNESPSSLKFFSTGGPGSRHINNELATKIRPFVPTNFEVLPELLSQQRAVNIRS